MLGWECYYEYVTGRANFLYICTRTQQFNAVLNLLKHARNQMKPGLFSSSLLFGRGVNSIRDKILTPPPPNLAKAKLFPYKNPKE